MEGIKKWHSCRLTIYGDTGRVRWCVGKESTWKCKIKILAIIPIILLSIIAVAIFVRAHSRKDDLHSHIFKQDVVTTSYRDSEALDNEDREILSSIKTSYFPTTPIPYPMIHKRENRRHERDLPLAINKNSKDSSSEDTSTLGSFKSKIYHSKNPVSEQYVNLEMEQIKIRDYEKDIFHWKDRIVKDEVLDKQAYIMLEYMNLEIDPCKDFYQFACGNWQKHNPIPPDKTAYDTFEKLRENLEYVLRDLLSEEDLNAETKNQPIKTEYNISIDYNADIPYQSEMVPSEVLVHEPNPLLKAKKLYKSCMNQEIINERGATPLLKLIQELGGWPIIDDNWNSSKTGWLELIAQLRLYNNDILISEWIGPDIRNSNQYIIQMDQTTLGLPNREYFLEERYSKFLEAYRIYIITAASLLGAPMVKTTQDADKIIEFERNLAEITLPQYERQNLTKGYSRMTVAQLQEKIPEMDFINYFNILMDYKIGPNEPIICYCMEYLQQLVSLISTTPPRTVTNYILWRFIRNRMNNLDERFLEAKQRFYFILYGRKELPPRQQTCVSQVNSNMGMALGHLFVKKYYDEKIKNDTIHITKNIQKAFYSILYNVEWLDSETKLLALEKLTTMQLHIGYPDFILNESELIQQYMKVETHENLYFENTLNLLQHLTQTELLKLHTPVNKSVWSMPPSTVNAYYSRNRNQIMFPAGILQPPFYHKHFPQCLNYGGIGVVIGHEIAHGFDDKGRLFDKEGNLKQWWEKNAIDAFHNRTQCLIDQYNSYDIPEVGEHIDGITTQGENIADNGGIKQAFKAYMEWVEENPNADESMPGINMSNKQLFFLNFAQVWCGISQPEAVHSKLRTAVHSPGRFRVIGSIRNLPEFSEAFHCPIDSPMNPRSKCTIW